MSLTVFDNLSLLFFLRCFDRFFKAVNQKEGKLITKRRGGYAMDDIELIGLDYLWRVSSSFMTQTSINDSRHCKDMF